MSATTARRARTAGPPSTRTTEARPATTSTPSTRIPVRISTPAARAREARASASMPAPPWGEGKPTSCASIARNQPKRPLPGASGGTSACMALPASSSRPRCPPNLSSPIRVTGSRKKRARAGRSEAPTRRASRVAASTGGQRVRRASRKGSLMRSYSATRSSQAWPSPGCSASSPAAVTVASEWIVAPSGSSGPAGVGDDDGGLAPAQPVVLEPEPRHHRRRDREGVAGAELVHDPAVSAHGRDGPADLVAGLDEDDVPAGVGEGDRRDETVGTPADDDGVGALRTGRLHRPMVTPRGPGRPSVGGLGVRA